MDIHDEVQAGNRAALDRYLAGGGDIHARTTLTRTLLHVAAQGGQSELIKVLIARGCEVDALDYKKNTPLHRAAGIGAAEGVRALLAAGAAATARDTAACTALHQVCHGGAGASAEDRLAIVEGLLEAGAELDGLDSSDRTPLWFAAATGTAPQAPAVMRARLEVVRRLLEKGADRHRKARGTMGTPIDAARGLHQAKKYRIAWPEALALLER